MARSGDSLGLLLVWERGRGIALTCTLTFVIGVAVDQDQVPWAQGIKRAELLYHASFVLVRRQLPLFFFTL